jgi:hypothetical protein
VKSKQTNFAHLYPARHWVVLACLLLVTFTVAAQALHAHADELSGDAKDCAICQVAHATVQVTPVAQLNLNFTAAISLSFSADPDPKQGPDSFSLFCRPPPSV